MSYFWKSKGYKGLLFFVVFLGLTPFAHAFELPNEMTLKTNFRTWEIKPPNLDFLGGTTEKDDFLGMEVHLNPEDAEKTAGLVSKSSQEGVDLTKIKRYLEDKISPAINRDKTTVTLDMDAEGHITFEGTGLYGRKLDVDAAATMMKYALENNLEFITLPLITEAPEVIVKSDKLKAMGIVELVSSGETDFSGSPNNRIHNINTGLSKFQGVVVKPGEEFSFGSTIGPVNGSTGYKKELVILGNKTVPEYGGGLCQVSTTAYRAMINAGYPILDRRNHSYMVSYYKPLGLDATFYEGGQDIRFLNDTPHHIVMQTFTQDNHTYYNFYGTKPNRTVQMIGPYYSNWRSAPSTKTEYSSSMAPGEKKVLGHAVPGVNVTWYRYVTYNDEFVTDQKTGEKKNKTFLETIFSNYEARPNYYMIGGPAPSEEAPPT